MSEVEQEVPRSLGKDDDVKVSSLPADYETWSPEKKMSFLWDEKIMPSMYPQPPEYPDPYPPLEKVKVVGLVMTDFRDKMGSAADQAPEGWKKAIHARGAVAKIKYEPAPGQPFTGLFETGGVGLLRMSITGEPSELGFAPGLALKVFVAGKPSQNVSALIRLKGSLTDHDLFRGDFSNIAQRECDLGVLAINAVFRRASKYPKKLYMQDWAEVKADGETVENPRFPFQVYFQPTDQVEHFEAPHEDFRKELASMKPGVKIFDVLAVDPGEYTDEAARRATQEMDDDQEAYKARAVLIGSVTITSQFVASLYGDSYLFFKHQSYANK